MTMDRSLTLEAISVGYPGREVIRDQNFAPVPAGAVTALVGPNAAGKSTLLRAIAGLIPSSGCLALGGRRLDRLGFDERAALVNYMPQALPNGVALKVIDSVVAALGAMRTRRDDDIAARAAEALRRTGIAHLAFEPLDRLSGGQRQMVAFAQAIARAPDVYLLDEPTSALDLRYQVSVMRLMRDLAEAGHMVIVVLHDLALAARWADHMIVLSKGTCAAQGRPADILNADLLAKVYGVSARVGLWQGSLHIAVDQPV